jgi:hypothetical protein
MGIYIKTTDNRFYLSEATHIKENYFDTDFIRVFKGETLLMSIRKTDVSYIIHNLSYNEFQTLSTDIKRGCIIK